MQTFLPYPSFTESARVLDNKRLGKQRVECLQILKTLAKGPTEVIQKVDGRTGDTVAIHRKTPWYNHPAVQMWKGYEQALALYACHCCYEWRCRGFADTCTEKICNMMLWTNNLEIELRNIKFDPQYPLYHYPPWLGNESFHASHRSNLLRKDFDYYSQFKWTEPTTLPYIWPSKDLTCLCHTH